MSRRPMANAGWPDNNCRKDATHGVDDRNSYVNSAYSEFLMKPTNIAEQKVLKSARNQITVDSEGLAFPPINPNYPYGGSAGDDGQRPIAAINPQQSS